MGNKIRKHVFLGVGDFGKDVQLKSHCQLQEILYDDNLFDKDAVSEYLPSRFFTLLSIEEKEQYENRNSLEFDFQYHKGMPLFLNSLRKYSDPNFINELIQEIIKLNNLSIEEVDRCFNSEISTTIEIPRVVIILNVNEYENEIKEIINSILQINDNRIENKYSLCCLLYCPRTGENKNKLEE